MLTHISAICHHQLVTILDIGMGHSVVDSKFGKSIQSELVKA